MRRPVLWVCYFFEMTMFNSRWAKDFGWGLVISTHHNCNGPSGFNIPTTRDRGDWICLQQPTTNASYFFNGFIPYKIVKYESLGIGQSIEYCLYHAVSSFVGTLMVFFSPHLFAGNQTHHVSHVSRCFTRIPIFNWWPPRKLLVCNAKARSAGWLFIHLRSLRVCFLRYCDN